jgi:circadian clock protein KaiB
MTSPATKMRVPRRRPKPARRAGVTNTQRYVLRLYVTGTTPASLRAIEAVRSICEQHLEGRYDLEIIDIYQLKALARDHQIVATPTLIRVQPEPLRRFVGDLSKVDRVLFGLDLPARKGPAPTVMSDALEDNARLAAEKLELRHRLDEVESLLAAARSGAADSLVLEGPSGPRIFSVEGTEHAYRTLVEAMNEGAATLAEDTTVLYCNARFAGMLAAPLPQVRGASHARFLPPRAQARIAWDHANGI